jgi:hypothetical protein
MNRNMDQNDDSFDEDDGSGSKSRATVYIQLLFVYHIVKLSHNLGAQVYYNPSILDESFACKMHHYTCIMHGLYYSLV